VVEASQLGLEPDGVLGHAYLVPFNNRKTGQREAQLIPGYKGLVELSRRSGNLSTIYAHVVHERDQYRFCYGLTPTLEHTPTGEPDPGPIVAAYAVAHLRDGGVQFEWLWKKEIDGIRAQSKAGSSGPWVTHYDEMAKKTALRRLCKLLPVSVELQRAVALDEMAEAGVPQRMDALAAASVDLPPQPSRLQQAAQQWTEPDGGDGDEQPHEAATLGDATTAPDPPAEPDQPPENLLEQTAESARLMAEYLEAVEQRLQAADDKGLQALAASGKDDDRLLPEHWSRVFAAITSARKTLAKKG